MGDKIARGVDRSVGAFGKMADAIHAIRKGLAYTELAILNLIHAGAKLNALHATIPQWVRDIHKLLRLPFAINEYLAKKVAGKATGAKKATAADFAKELKQDIAEVQKRLEDLDKVKPSDAIREWYEGVKKAAETAGNAIADSKNRLEEFQDTDRLAKIGDAKQVRLARTAIHDRSSDALAIVLSTLEASRFREQLVKDPQLQETNTILTSIHSELKEQVGLG
jgi:hypothetical protein